MRTFLMATGLIWLGLAGLFVFALMSSARKRMPSPPSFSRSVRRRPRPDKKPPRQPATALAD